MRSNVTQGQGVVVDKAAELAVYDALPERWRRLVDSLPIPQRVSSIEVYRTQLGDDAGYARVVEVFQAKYPGWTPPDPIVVSLPSQSVMTILPGTRVPLRQRRGMIVVQTSEN